MPDNDEVRTAPRSPPTALGLGERLRSARKAKALSVEQVSEVLRLEEPLVTAIEEERFEALGAPVFVRGHLRRYAQLVGLPVESVLDAYRAAAPESSEPPALIRRRIEPAIDGVGSWVLWLAGAVLLIVMVFFLVDDQEPAQSSLPVAPALPVPEPLPTPVPLPDTATSVRTLPASPDGAEPAGTLSQPLSPPAAPMPPTGAPGAESSPPLTTPAAATEPVTGAAPRTPSP
jgi:cytoskeleton protein RodZ